MSFVRSSCTRWCALVALAASAILTAVPSDAQILYGSIVGVVKDAQGADIPGATVTHHQQGNEPHAGS